MTLDTRVESIDRQLCDVRAAASDARGRSLALQDIMLGHERRLVAAETEAARLRGQIQDLVAQVKAANQRVEQALGHIAQLTRHLGEVSATARSTRERVDRMPWGQGGAQ